MTLGPWNLLRLCFVLALPLSGTGCADGPVPDSAWREVAPDEAVLQALPMGPVRYLSIHHTQTPVPDSVSEVQRLRNIQHFHQVEKGWGDIAYHFLIGPSGTVYPGRSIAYAASSGTTYLTREQWEATPQDKDGKTTGSPAPGTEKPGATAGHITICFIGDFSLKLPTVEARRSAIQLVARLMREHQLGPEAILMHREIAATDCPGQALYDWFRGPGRTRSGRGEGFAWLDQEAAP